MSNGEEEVVLECVAVVSPYSIVYCGLVSPHRLVGGDQVTLTAPRVSIGANETMIGAPTAAWEAGNNFECANTITLVCLLFSMTYVHIRNLCMPP